MGHRRRPAGNLVSGAETCASELITVRSPPRRAPASRGKCWRWKPRWRRGRTWKCCASPPVRPTIRIGSWRSVRRGPARRTACTVRASAFISRCASCRAPSAPSGLPLHRHRQHRPAALRRAGRHRYALLLHDVFQLTLDNYHASLARALAYRLIDWAGTARSLRLADAVWTPSRYTAQAAAKLFPRQRAKLAVLPNAVPWRPAPGHAAAGRLAGALLAGGGRARAAQEHALVRRAMAAGARAPATCRRWLWWRGRKSCRPNCGGWMA